MTLSGDRHVDMLIAGSFVSFAIMVIIDMVAL